MIFKIFRHDCRRVFSNLAAVVILIGITLLPSLYAWFNIAANWDPYGNTDQMAFAVVNEDAGTSVENIEINIGGEIYEQLEQNQNIAWDFVDRQTAMDGVYSGKYYAALVIPEDFSASLTGLLNEDIQSLQITYYVNQKENAIAPKITDSAMNTVKVQVNAAFISTVVETLSDMMGLTVDSVESRGEELIDQSVAALEEGKSALTLTRQSLASFSELAGSVMNLSDTASDLTDGASDALTDGVTLANNLDEILQNVRQAGATIASAAGDQIASAQTDLSSLRTMLEQAQQSDSAQAAELLRQSSALAANLSSSLGTLADTLEELSASLAAPSTEVTQSVDILRDLASQAQSFSDSLSSGADTIDQTGELTAITTFIHTADQLSAGLSSLQASYTASVQPALEQALDDATASVANLSSLLSSLQGSIPVTGNIAASAQSSLDVCRQAMDATVSLLDGILANLDTTIDHISGLKESQAFLSLVDSLTSHPEELGDFMASPVEVVTEEIYPIENYGSAMAPFYSVLAIWVGAVVLVAILKVNLTPQAAMELGNPNTHQVYIGRYLFFLMVAAMQGLIICLGDLLFLQIQCEHPILFCLSGVACSISFSFLVYTLVVAFGDVGKAIAVILLVVQIGSTAGTFPIELTPNFFRAIYPYMPFTYGIRAMRECVAGMYGGEYWLDLLILGAYILLAALIGFVIRLPLRKLVEHFEHRIHDTGVM